jgi:hypothetical protein
MLFLPCGHMLPWWWVVCRVVTGNLIYQRAGPCPAKAPMRPHASNSLVVTLNPHEYNNRVVATPSRSAGILKVGI